MIERGYNLQPRRPPWAGRPPTDRELSAKQPILAPPIPGEVTYAPVVSGQKMRVGEPIAQADSETCVNVLASISEQVIAVDENPVQRQYEIMKAPKRRWFES